jgi:Pyruvate/2-oxoacid:ferredoxin oxidoreductase gamma subunit
MMRKIFKLLVKIGLGASGGAGTAAGVAIAMSNPITGAIMGITGLVTAASSISSAIKDKKLGKIEPIVNLLACNIDEASNDIERNYHKKW